MANYCIIAIGEEHRKDFLNNIKYIDKKSTIYLQTDDYIEVEGYNIFNMAPTNKGVFNYFEQYYWPIFISQCIRQQVIYADADKLKDAVKASHIPQDDNFYVQSGWKGSWYTKAYWSKAVKYMESLGVDPTEVTPVLEQVGILPYNSYLNDIVLDLKAAEKLWIEIGSEDNSFSGKGNGQGLALGLSFKLRGIKPIQIENIRIKSTALNE
tara:strand:+ start:327 stop:956 length:630 start_codon:yes stop_codon:yes gene_type:complete